MEDDSEIFVGFDVAKARHAVAVAEYGRQGEVRFLGEIDADPVSVRRLVARLEKRRARLCGATERCPVAARWKIALGDAARHEALVAQRHEVAAFSFLSLLPSRV